MNAREDLELDSSTYGTRIARHGAQARSRQLLPGVIDRAKLHILDTLAAVVSGADLEAGRAGKRYAESVSGAPQASVLGTHICAPLIEAALANGMAAHADESDDSHEESQTHPGCGVVPAAIVVAEEQRSSGRDFLRAVVLGYDMTTRFAQAFGSGMSFKNSSLSSHAYGPLIGGGYAAGSLMGFDEGGFRILLNYLAQEASGLTTWRLDERHTLKSYVFGGMPASNAVKAVALVRSGFTGGGDVLDLTSRNMLDAICPDPRPDALIDRLGEHYTIVETDIKKYPVGYPIAAPLAALEQIIAAHPFDPQDVTEVRVYYHEDWYKVIGDRSRMPDVNLRYCLAVTLLDGSLSFEASHDADRMATGEVIDLGNRIKMLGPQPYLDRFAARVEILVGDQVFGAEQGRNVLGRAENPMSKTQVQAKALELMSPVIGEAGALRAVEMVDKLDQIADMREVVAQLRRPL
jgi:2-methylcitrate dehydratase PrpD